MILEKTKKRGRPAQLLQVAELRDFMHFLRCQEYSELRSDVISLLIDHKYNLERLSQSQQILVKEALKPYRDHMKMQLLADQLAAEKNNSEYEKKFLELHQQYEQGDLESKDINLLKMMCNRYLRFKAQKLNVSDLELYLSQIQKTEAKKKRTTENRRKFEVGGAIIAACNELQINSGASAETIKTQYIEYYKYFRRMRETQLFAEASALTRSYTLEDDVIVTVLNKLSNYKIDGKSITTIEIEKAISEVRNR